MYLNSGLSGGGVQKQLVHINDANECSDKCLQVNGCKSFELKVCIPQNDSSNLIVL